jgi:hypothetical protein
MLLKLLENVFTPTEPAEVEYFLDHGENGVALGTFWAICTEEGHSISGAAHRLVSDLVTRMEIELDEWC